ncbi:MAG TPA: GvpL/GvpF family gas vesicle protein [Solirubrobacteraceae bacterium]|nr:GvpL/GvpF family gas vesicle protein [Solirubrobacteraceae bacterium]
MIELLAIADGTLAPEEPVRAVPCHGLSVLCAPAGDGEADAEMLWRRETLLETLMEHGALLPLRYGTVVADEAAAVEAVSARRDAFARALARVRGAVELSVRAVGPADAAPAAARVHATLAVLARDAVRLGGDEQLNGAYLVERGAVDDFVAAVGRLQREHRALSILCTGPWPPYSFTEAG